MWWCPFVYLGLNSLETTNGLLGMAVVSAVDMYLMHGYLTKKMAGVTFLHQKNVHA